MAWRLVACVVVVALLAGCCDIPFHPTDIAADAPAEGGPGPRTVTLDVFDPDEPADDVPFYILWQDPDNAQHVYLMGLRTENGRATAHVPAGLALHVMIGGGERTLELGLDAVAAGTAPASVSLRIYPYQVGGTFEGSWSPAAVGVYDYAGFQGAYHLHDVTPGASAETKAGYTQRLRSLDAQVTWSNDLTTQADLGVGAWHQGADGYRCIFLNNADEFGAAGTHTESHMRIEERFRECGTPTPEGGIVLGPGTGQPALMPFGLAYSGNYTLRFGDGARLGEVCDRLASEDYVLHYVDPRSGAVFRRQNAEGGPSPELPTASAVLVILAFVALAAVMARRRAR